MMVEPDLMARRLATVPAARMAAKIQPSYARNVIVHRQALVGRAPAAMRVVPVADRVMLAAVDRLAPEGSVTRWKVQSQVKMALVVNLVRQARRIKVAAWVLLVLTAPSARWEPQAQAQDRLRL